MRPVSIAVLMVILLGVGVYIGVSGLADQIGGNLDLSRGSAADVTCEPDRSEAVAGQAVTFALSGIDAAAPFHWSAPSGTAQTLPDGRLSVRFAASGAQYVSAFIPGTGTQWRRISCSVTIR